LRRKKRKKRKKFRVRHPRQKGPDLHKAHPTWGKREGENLIIKPRGKNTNAGNEAQQDCLARSSVPQKVYEKGEGTRRKRRSWSNEKVKVHPFRPGL